MSREERTVLFQLPTMVAGQLICTQGTLAGRSWNLSAGTFVIGRQAGSDLTLATEPGVSKLHAKILAEGDHYSLVDNESRNGTIVNGRPIQKARLKTGDEIRICNCVLRFTQTGGGLPATDSAAASFEGEPDFDVAGGTSPEVADMTAAGGPPASMEPPPSSPRLDVADPAPPAFSAAGRGAVSQVAPTAEYVAASVDVPRPPPQIRVQSAAPWFVIGLLTIVVIGAGSWAGLRFFGDALLGPMPTALASADDESANDPIARERAAEAAAGKSPDDAKDDDGELAQADDAAGDEDPRAADDEATEEAGEDDRVAAADDSAADDAAAEDPVADDVAAAEAAAAEEEAAAASKVAAASAKPPVVTGRKTPKITKPAPVDEEPSEDDEGEPAAASASAGPSSWYAVVVEREGPLAVKTRAGGTVGVVAASEGQGVKRGELLFSFEDAGSDEISNLRANIEALESVAESQPSAQEMLDREKEKLKRLLAKSGDVNVTSPGAGTLTGFAVKVGDKLKAGDAVGTVERGGATITVNVPAADGRRLKRGGSVELKTGSGAASGRIESVKKRGGAYRVVLETDASADDVKEARFP